MQLHIDFSPVHHYENNPFSQAHLDEYRDKFGNDCWNILRELISGKRLTYKYAIETGLSGDLRARIRDIRRGIGVTVLDEWVNTANGRRFKVYYMGDDERAQAIRIISERQNVKNDTTRKNRIS